MRRKTSLIHQHRFLSPELFYLCVVTDSLTLIIICMKDEVSNMLSASIVSAINIGTSSLTPEIAPFFAGVSPLLQDFFINLFRGFANSKRLTQNECERLGVSYSTAVNIINARIQKGDHIRKELHGNYGIDDIIESSLRFAIDDAEKHKAAMYGNFVGNVSFSNTDRETLVFLNKIVHEMSYFDFCVASAFIGRRPIELINMEQAILRRENESYLIRVKASIMTLKRVGVLNRTSFTHSMTDIGEIFLSEIGVLLCDLACVGNVVEEDVAGIKATIDRF